MTGNLMIPIRGQKYFSLLLKVIQTQLEPLIMLKRHSVKAADTTVDTYLGSVHTLSTKAMANVIINFDIMIL